MLEFEPFLVPLTGNENFIYEECSMPFSVLEFWQWSASNLLSNATRGVLAEFLVAKALGVDASKCREEWASFDLETSCGVKVEVKSASYLQGWEQKQLSPIIYVVKPTRALDSKTGKRSNLTERSADVYVFAMLAHKDRASVNPLNLD
ncbi:MAG: hypothetical protein SGJ17_04695 [Hyphomicrobiales bacterium]|nr:hypothetical protein [Hyphomicrobiales bacterium]